ncbi:MAG: septum formation initiator family protein [Candidatus Omnitrophica bacterium]|nr:septum formation initiator family protein [Candidatus Omnitrophota bacterium]MBU1047815.1 septum formation initiator family protein [Candidatus Omnitrophota bacterium]MBU1631202.1 septum formation initiator family protein [Candidatus Omnitrophota bacterium]MBU1767210.1 septum formation initiator family protein [Candidatus Omnitrophota bacterium]MBU1888650.1 septum formation initiator family protein [Candidatus Omnitrophota bacterium]
MRKRGNDKKWVWVIAFVFLGGFLMYLLIPNYSTLVRYQEDYEALNIQINELEKENENLKIEIRKLKTDPLYIEKIARKELGMTRQGEIIYRITPTHPAGDSELNDSADKKE